MFQSINPYTLEVIKNYSFTSETDLNIVLEKSKNAFSSWKNETLYSRCVEIKRVGELLEARIEEASLLITKEMGKPISQSRSEIQKCVDLEYSYPIPRVDIER